MAVLPIGCEVRANGIWFDAVVIDGMFGGNVVSK